MKLRPHFCPFCDEQFTLVHVGRCRDAIVYVVEEIQAETVRRLESMTDQQMIDQAIETFRQVLGAQGKDVPQRVIDHQRAYAAQSLRRMRRNFGIAGPKST